MRQHVSIRFQIPLNPVRMRKVFCSLVLLGLCYVSCAQAQLAAPPKPVPTDEHHIFDDELYRWWWGYTPSQVYDKILSEPGWKVIGPEEDESHDPDFKRISAQYTQVASTTDFTNLFFTFFQGQLIRRAYFLSESNPLVSTWNEQLAKWPYDERNSCWLDEHHHAKIKRRYHDVYVMYDIEPYYAEGTKK